MTDEEAKSLGFRAIYAGMPWTKLILDGSIGEAIHGPDWHREVQRLAIFPKSWPDFRDPLTEAWLFSWAIRKLQAKFPLCSFKAHQSDTFFIIFKYDSRWTSRIASAKWESEAWIAAIERFREP